MLKFTAIILTVAGAAHCTQAAVQLPEIISDNMVLQRSDSTRMWGKADPGEKVTVTFDTISAEAIANTGGQWELFLDLQDAPSSPGELIITASNTIIIQNAIVGDVWLASGQSNMSWTVDHSTNYEQEALDFPEIREFWVPQVIAYQPQDDTSGARWVVATPETTPRFSAVGFYFVRELHQKTGRSMGIVRPAWGGTIAEAWTSKSQLEKEPIYAASLAEQVTAVGDRALPTDGEQINPNQPAVLYNAMIHPVRNYRIKGAIWYQGESNTHLWQHYERLLTLMIEGWRADWNVGDFPFYIVQLANYTERKDDPGEDAAWARLRDAQWNIARTLPNSGMASAIDLGEADDIHPRNKQDVGERLALIALARDYGQNVVYANPEVKGITIKDNQAILSVAHADGLHARDGEPRRFAIAGKDGKFVWAEAKIDGEQIVVWSDEVATPVEVRYGRSTNPEVNVYNGAGLPLVPFVIRAE